MPVLEIILVGAALAAALWWARPGWGVAAGALVGAAALWWATPARRPDPLAAALPQAHARSSFVRSDSCRGCHPGEYASWRGTYHRTMTQAATPTAVLADFSGELVAYGQRFALKREGDGFFVKVAEAPDDDWARVVMTTGSHHMQGYWVQAGPWYVQFPWMWRIAAREWVPLADSFLRVAPTGPERPSRWNMGCIFCHATGGEVLGATDAQAAAHVGELGIACEACHRDAAEHAAAMRNPALRYLRHFDDARDGTVLNPNEVDHQTQAAVCGRCHSVSVPLPGHDALADQIKPGDPLRLDRIIVQVAPNPIAGGDRILPPRAGVTPTLTVQTADGPVRAQLRGLGGHALYLDAPGLTAGFATAELRDPANEPGRVFTLAGRLRPYPGGAEFTLDAPPAAIVAVLADVLGYGAQSPSEWDMDSFWDDGAVRTVGREYNGMVRSACYRRGELDCGDCHSMHDYAQPDDLLRPGMDGDQACLQCHAQLGADVAAHTHHPAESAGSRCMNCHMPNTTYGLLGATRAHDIDRPSAASSFRTGRPNACNLCHLDQPLAWAAERLTEWYGQPAVELPEAERTIAAGALWLTRGDAAQRAITAWHTAWPPAVEASGADWTTPLVADLLNDDYAAVRAIAAAALVPALAGRGYHFVEPPEDRARVAEAVIADWALEAPPRVGEALLLTAPGVRDEARLRALRAQRDDRPIQISE